MPDTPAVRWCGTEVVGLAVKLHPAAGISLVCTLHGTRHVVRAHRASDRPGSRASAWCRACQSHTCVGCQYALDTVHEWRADLDGPRAPRAPSLHPT